MYGETSSEIRTLQLSQDILPPRWLWWTFTNSVYVQQHWTHAIRVIKLESLHLLANCPTPLMDSFIFMYLQPFSKCDICQIGEYRTKTKREILFVNFIGTKKQLQKVRGCSYNASVCVRQDAAYAMLLNCKWNQVEASVKSKDNGRLTDYKRLMLQHVQSG